jgi:NifU-like protein involved in Fe-S cluster formation
VKAGAVQADPRYSEQVRRLFETTPGSGAPADRAGWVQGEARDDLTQTWVRWYLRAEGGRIAGARYEVRGCPHTIAAAARIAAGLVGRPLEPPLVAVDVAAIALELNVPAEKLGRLFVIEDAIGRAVLLLRGARA